MKCIKEYIRDGKKLYRVNNLYLGIDPYTRKEVRRGGSGFESRKEANLFISRMKLEFQNGTLFGINKRQTFKDIYELWFIDHKREVKESTIRNIDSYSKNLLESIGSKHINKITRIDIQGLVNSYIDAGYKKNTIKGRLSIIKMVFDYALFNNIISVNPVVGVRIRYKEENFEDITQKFYEKHELLHFLDILKKNYDTQTQAIFSLLAYTGARVGEVLALEWSDIDFKAKTIDINKTIAMNLENKIIVQPPKSKSSRRVLQVGSETIEILLKYKEEQFTNKGILFKNSKKNYFFTTNITDKYKAICKKYNIRYITTHGFRHTHCTLLCESGVDLKAAQDRLGHGDIKMTAKIYAHTTKKMRENLGNKFEEYLSAI